MFFLILPSIIHGKLCTRIVISMYAYKCTSVSTSISRQLAYGTGIIYCDTRIFIVIVLSVEIGVRFSTDTLGKIGKIKCVKKSVP